jgi:cellulose synthase/poly-beta-1,6-N-acetylglucosamine synthase-like glycosyltransferase
MLGEALIARGVISENELERALLIQRRYGGRLGDILVGQGFSGTLELYRAVAEHHGLTFVNLLEDPPAPGLLRPEEAQDYLQLRALPIRRMAEAIVIATSEPGPEVEAWATRRFGAVAFVITSPVDIKRAVEREFGAQMEEESRLALFRARPQHSARQTFQRDQRLTFIGLALGAALAFALYPFAAVAWTVAGMHALYFAAMVFKCMVHLESLRRPAKSYAYNRAGAARDEDLPLYTILVPMYREARNLPHLLASLARLDYPAHRLDIKLVLEERDRETIAAAHALKPHWNLDIVVVPDSQPRTKPKACNYALRFARGDYVTIYDTEDEPEPQQLRKAVHAFRTLPRDVACLQARLNYYNADDNWLTRWFALEYATLFDLTLPGLQAMGIPIPLGGTSNHLALKVLREAGEWDPYNVTEDADLGIRLAALGLRTAMLDSVTMEEAPLRVGAWLRQRSRWIKGHMQTWLVHMRDPLALWRRVGTVSFLGIQFFMGLSSLMFLSAPVVWLFSAPMLLWHGFAAHIPAPAWLLPLASLNLGLYFVMHTGTALLALRRLPACPHPSGQLVMAIYLYPLYWALHSAASYKALWQLIWRPHYWEKTTHGLTKVKRNQAVRV